MSEVSGEEERRRLDASIIVAVGGNLGGRAVLDAAVDALAGEGMALQRRSRFWRSAAWPDAADPPFLNAVAWVESGLAPEAILQALHRIEGRLGRVRGRRNGPRTVDLDLVAHGRRVERSGAEGLQLPHPRAADRLFVMGPLAEIAPHWRHPTLGRTAAELAASAAIGRDARPE